MRALVTGANGFVGKYLVQRLAEQCEVVALAGPHDARDGQPAADILDAAALDAAFDAANPDVVFHLAAQAFVPRAIAQPEETYRINVLGTANVVRAFRDLQKGRRERGRFVFVSSAEVYGIQPPASMPLSERVPPEPANPYAASKAAAEAIVMGEARTFGVDAIVTRAFNHIGPGQDPRFAVPSFARQLAAIAGGADPKLLVGNLDAKRDFLDVRDVVEAYVQLALHGKPGETYNVCSGSAIAMKDVLAQLVRIAKVPVEIREDPARMRPSDTPLLCGDNHKIRSQTGWMPKIRLERSLNDIYREALAESVGATAKNAQP